MSQPGEIEELCAAVRALVPGAECSGPGVAYCRLRQRSATIYPACTDHVRHYGCTIFLHGPGARDGMEQHSRLTAFIAVQAAARWLEEGP